MIGDNMKTLCLYYSRTNLTRVIMRRIAMLTDADLYEYTDGKERSGIRGYISSCIDSYRRAPKVHIAGDEPEAYLSVQTKNHDPETEIKRFVREMG